MCGHDQFKLSLKFSLTTTTATAPPNNIHGEIMWCASYVLVYACTRCVLQNLPPFQIHIFTQSNISVNAWTACVRIRITSTYQPTPNAFKLNFRHWSEKIHQRKWAACELMYTNVFIYTFILLTWNNNVSRKSKVLAQEKRRIKALISLGESI